MKTEMDEGWFHLAGIVPGQESYFTDYHYSYFSEVQYYSCHLGYY